MSIKLVTGSTGTKHVTAADDGALHAALAGDGLIVFDTGAKLGATVMSSTSVRIADGEGLLDGRHFRIKPGEYVELELPEGVSGYYRNDLVLLHYLNDFDLESISLEVVSGEYNATAAVDPSYTVSDTGIIDGATELFIPLYRLSRNGINPPTVEQLFTVSPVLGEQLKALEKSLEDVSKDVDDLTGAIKVTDNGIDLNGKYIDNALFR